MLLFFRSLQFTFSSLRFVFSSVQFAFYYFWNCDFQDEIICTEREHGYAVGFKFSVDAVNALAIFLYIVIRLQKCSYFRISGEMSVSNIGGLNHTWQFAWRLEYEAVIKHFYLYFRSFDAVGSVTAGIYHHLLNNEFGVVTLCDKLGILS